ADAAMGFRARFGHGPGIDPPRGCRHHSPGPARPAPGRGDTRRAASAPPRPRALFHPRRRPADARTAGSITPRRGPRRPAPATGQALTGTARPPPPPSCPMPGWIARHGGDPERSVTLVMTDQHADTHEPPTHPAVPLM